MSSNYFPNRSFVLSILFSFSNSFHSQKITSCAPRPIREEGRQLKRAIMKHSVLLQTELMMSAERQIFYIILIVSVCFSVYFLQCKLSVALTKAVKHMQMRESNAPNLINADLGELQLYFSAVYLYFLIIHIFCLLLNIFLHALRYLYTMFFISHMGIKQQLS